MGTKKSKYFLDWFVTESGRSFTLGAVCTAGIGCIALHFLPNTLLLSKYQEIVTSYRDGLSVPVAEAVCNRFEKTMDILEMPERERRFLKPFTVFGFDTFSAGSVRSRWGAIIGLPISFTYKSVDSINKKTINVKNEPVNWSKEEAAQLLEALVLSDNAQMFAIAKEIQERRSLKIIFDASYPLTVLCGMYAVGQSLNKKLNFYTRPPVLRYALYSLLSLFGYGLYSFLTDFTQMAYDQIIDRDLADKNQVFVEGGFEYYSKIVERNKALRKLMGTSGEKLYSVYGNENFFVRQKRLPLNVRKLFFESKLKGVDMEEL